MVAYLAKDAIQNQAIKGSKISYNLPLFSYIIMNGSKLLGMENTAMMKMEINRESFKAVRLKMC